MPFNLKEARTDLQVAQAYSGGPMGEYISKLATHLVDAMAEIDEAHRRAIKAESDLSRAEQDRDLALATTRKLREGQTGLPEALETLKAIARNPKGAAKLAKECVAKIEGGKSE